MLAIKWEEPEVVEETRNIGSVLTPLDGRYQIFEIKMRGSVPLRWQSTEGVLQVDICSQRWILARGGAERESLLVNFSIWREECKLWGSNFAARSLVPALGVEQSKQRAIEEAEEHIDALDWQIRRSELDALDRDDASAFQDSRLARGLYLSTLLNAIAHPCQNATLN